MVMPKLGSLACVETANLGRKFHPATNEGIDIVTAKKENLV